MHRGEPSQPAASSQPSVSSDTGAVRDPLALPEAVIESRARPMSERLAQALSFNAVAAELRAGMIEANGDDAAP